MEDHDDQAVHRLGKMLRVAFNEVEAVDWKWPTTTAEVSDFLVHGRHVFQQVRAAGGVRGSSDKRYGPGYVTLTFVRNALVAQIAAHAPLAMQKFTMAQVVGVLSSSAVLALSRRSPRYPAAVVIFTSSFSALSRRCFLRFPRGISPVSHHWYPAIISPQLNYLTSISPLVISPLL